MKVTRKSKGKGIVKVVTMSALSLGLFSAAFVGVNNLAFAAATSDATPLEIAAAPIVAQQVAHLPQGETSSEASAFTPPNITVIQAEAIRGESVQEVPSTAISMEEAALIGAEYIWDVFGTNIDGMYVEMMYALTPGFTRPTWIGSVSAERPVRPDFGALNNAASAGSTLMPAVEIRVLPPSYSFRIDALTGMRVDISYLHPSFNRPQLQLTDEEILQQRMEIIESETISSYRSGWFEMIAETQLEQSGITPERLEHYESQALELAQRHFNLTAVQDIRLGDAQSETLTFNSGTFTSSFYTITFTATDNTGREAIIRIPTENAGWRFTSVSTLHNDFIPGFSYDRPGIG